MACFALFVGLVQAKPLADATKRKDVRVIQPAIKQATLNKRLQDKRYRKGDSSVPTRMVRTEVIDLDTSLPKRFEAQPLQNPMQPEARPLSSGEKRYKAEYRGSADYQKLYKNALQRELSKRLQKRYAEEQASAPEANVSLDDINRNAKVQQSGKETIPAERAGSGKLP